MRSSHPAGRLPDPPSPIADDGDATRFCRTCAFAGACIAVGYGKPELEALHCLVDKDGREQVLGFYLPGEVIGLNAIYPEHFPCDAVALENTQFCRFSFPAMSALAARMPAVQQHLFRLLSKELGTASLLAGDHSADERMAAFLCDLARRYEARGFSGTHFTLSMSRGDIANYLRLASETVSRVLTRFRSQGLIAIEGRGLELLDVKGLEKIGQNLLPD